MGNLRIDEAPYVADSVCEVHPAYHPIASSARVPLGYGKGGHMPGPISQAELNTCCRLTLVDLKPRCHSLRLTGASPFLEPSGHRMFGSRDRGNGGSESITRAGERSCWASSWGDIVLIYPASNTQFNGLSDLNVQDLGRGPTGEGSVKSGTESGADGCTLN